MRQKTSLNPSSLRRAIAFSVLCATACVPCGLAALAAGPAEEPKVIAKQCREKGAEEACEYLVVDRGWVKTIARGGRGEPHVVGPYLREYQHLVADSEAPVKELTSPRDWRVVVTRGFDRVPRPMPTFFLYFFDSQGELKLKVRGDIFLERIQVGFIFGTPTELLLVTERSETGISYSTEVWCLPQEGLPKRLLFEGGAVERIVPPSPAGLGGLVIVYTEAGAARQQERTREGFWAWDEKSQRFRPEAGVPPSR